MNFENFENFDCQISSRPHSQSETSSHLPGCNLQAFESAFAKFARIDLRAACLSCCMACLVCLVEVWVYRSSRYCNTDWFLEDLFEDAEVYSNNSSTCYNSLCSNAGMCEHFRWLCAELCTSPPPDCSSTKEMNAPSGSIGSHWLRSELQREAPSAQLLVAGRAAGSLFVSERFQIPSTTRRIFRSSRLTSSGAAGCLPWAVSCEPPQTVGPQPGQPDGLLAVLKSQSWLLGVHFDQR